VHRWRHAQRFVNPRKVVVNEWPDLAAAPFLGFDELVPEPLGAERRVFRAFDVFSDKRLAVRTDV
jgi:hypothetical protein